MNQPVTVTYLEMTSHEQLRPKPAPAGCEVVMVAEPSPEVNQFFYNGVGSNYSWTDRLPWPRERWLAYLNELGVETWILKVNGEQAGYFELAPQADGEIDVMLFGLLPAFTGQGFGGYLLTVAVERAWANGAKTVTVNSCTLDHPMALGHYLARGFRIVGKKVKSGLHS